MQVPNKSSKGRFGMHLLSLFFLNHWTLLRGVITGCLSIGSENWVDVETWACCWSHLQNKRKQKKKIKESYVKLAFASFKVWNFSVFLFYYRCSPSLMSLAITLFCYLQINVLFLCFHNCIVSSSVIDPWILSVRQRWNAKFSHALLHLGPHLASWFSIPTVCHEQMTAISYCPV